MAGADVLLLGKVKLTVYADPGPREGTFRYSISPQPATPRPPSVKTDGQGRFSLQNGPSPADRMAVVSDRTLLWELTRKEVPDANDFVLTLPAPGELRIHAEIPGKPAKLEYWIVGRPPGRVDWASDSVFCRGIEVPNPGERVLPFLPGQFAVERLNLTPTGIRTDLMSQIERRLLVLESGKRTDSSYDRKTGRPVEGRVRGLEEVKLRYALVNISYFGPEEHFKPGDKPSRMMTTFDVIPITSDGRFTTPPLPPNQYEFRLTGMRASTPAEDGNPFDFQEGVKVKVTEAGPAKPVEIVVKTKKAPPTARRTGAPDPKKPRLELHARDESERSGQGLRSPALRSAKRLVPSGDGDRRRGDHGRQRGDKLEARRPDRLRRGLRFDDRGNGPDRRPAQGRRYPQAGKRFACAFATPRVSRSRPTSCRCLWFICRGTGATPGPRPRIKDTTMRERTIAAINFLNVRRDAGGDFAFNIRTDQATPIYFGFGHPDVLLYFETAPLTCVRTCRGNLGRRHSSARDSCDLDQATARRGRQTHLRGSLLHTVPNKPGFENSVPVLDSGELKKPDWQATLPRLAPGAYGIYIQTTPRDAATRPPSLEAHSGLLRPAKVEVKAGERTAVVFEPAPLNAECVAWTARPPCSSPRPATDHQAASLIVCRTRFLSTVACPLSREA